ncbi:MAG: SpoIID/LytB domain-containing protein, partial [Bacteroidota bacterium]
MKTTPNPEIHVGVVLATRIKFWFEGSFGLGQGDDPFTGELEASVIDGEIEVYRNGTRMARAGEFVFTSAEEAGSFGIREVVIGIGFHWEQKEDQVFRGALKLMLLDGKIQAVNIVPVEEYLVSVISSEMRGDSAPALLKAHTIISRSWLLAQIEKQGLLAAEDHKADTFQESEEEVIRWYDREDHTGFHVCADDHCQRYQGVTRASNPGVEKAVQETRGEVLD